MDYEPGPIDPLDRPTFERWLSPGIADGLAGDVAADSGPIADHAAALGLVTDDATFSATPDMSASDGNDLVDASSSVTDLVDAGFGQPDTSIAGATDAHAAASDKLHDDMVDAPDFSSMTFPTPPPGAMDPYDPTQKDPPPQ